MPVPEHIKVSFRGRFEETPEHWSHSHNLRLPTGLETFGTGGINVDDLRAAWYALAQGTMNKRCVLEDIRVYKIGKDGRMQGNPAVYLFNASTAMASGNDSVIYPPQVSLVVTTVAENRGPGRFGRFYLPMPRWTLASDARLSTSNRDSAVTAAATFLRALRDSYRMPGVPDTADVNPVNVSTLGGNGQGTMQVISEVRVGRVLDTQRRRRASMDEDYGSAAL